MECATSLTDMEEVSNFSSRLKHDVQAVCTKLALLGEESVLLSVKLADKSSKYVGSPLGKAFLLKRLDILEDFYQFCKSMHSEEISGFVFDKDKVVVKETAKCRNDQIRSRGQTCQYDHPSQTTSQTATQSQPVSVAGFQEGDAYVIEINDEYDNTQKLAGIQSPKVGNLQNPNLLPRLQLDKQEPTISKFAQKVFRNAMLYNNSGGLQRDNMLNDHLYRQNKESAIFTVMSDTSGLNGVESDHLVKPENDSLVDGQRSNTVSRRKGIFKTPTRLPSTNDCLPVIHDESNSNNISSSQNGNSNQALGVSVGDFQNTADNTGDNLVSSSAEDMADNGKENTMKITHVWTLTGNFHSAEIGDTNDVSVQPCGSTGLETVFPQPDTSSNMPASEIKSSPSVKWGSNTMVPDTRSSTAAKWNAQKLAKEIVAGKRLIKPKFPVVVLGRRETRSSKNLKLKTAIKHDDKATAVPKRYTCNICGKTYNKSCSLKAHMNLHTGNKLCRCEVCGKGFTKKKSLQTHMYLHTGEQPHACEICGKKFTLQCNLNIHKQLHMGLKPYECEVCHKEFTQLGNMKTHLRTHGNQKPKPFTCSVCDKQFMHQSTLNKHVKVHNQTYIL